jgi:hypothetical protein
VTWSGTFALQARILQVNAKKAETRRPRPVFDLSCGSGGLLDAVGAQALLGLEGFDLEFVDPAQIRRRTLAPSCGFCENLDPRYPKGLNSVLSRIVTKYHWDNYPLVKI